MFKNIRLIPLILCSVLPCGFLPAQTSQDSTAFRKAFEGTWYCKTEKHYLILSFDDYSETGYVTVNEWTGKRADQEHADAYKVFPEGDKLVFPEDKEEHRHPYCEIIRKDNRLLFRCKGMFADTARFTEQTFFTRLKT